VGRLWDGFEHFFLIPGRFFLSESQERRLRNSLNSRDLGTNRRESFGPPGGVQTLREVHRIPLFSAPVSTQARFCGTVVGRFRGFWWPSRAAWTPGAVAQAGTIGGDLPTLAGRTSALPVGRSTALDTPTLSAHPRPPGGLFGRFHRYIGIGFGSGAVSQEMNCARFAGESFSLHLASQAK
jgi:hypothetical protein